MDNNELEFKALREMREINISIKELINQSSSIQRRYKQGVKLLQIELLKIEACLDDQVGLFPGTEPWNDQSPQLKALIANPILSNIPEDVRV